MMGEEKTGERKGKTRKTGWGEREQPFFTVTGCLRFGLFRVRLRAGRNAAAG